jgi:hypothetical protein
VGAGGSGFAETGADRVEDPLLVGELAGLEFGVEQFPVGGQFKAAASGRDQLQVANLFLIRAEQFARQTDGLRLVVSHRTVLQFQVHDVSPSVPLHFTRPDMVG